MGSCISTDTYENNHNVRNFSRERDDRTNDEMTKEEAMDREARQMINSMKGRNGFD
jgi:hypothetical protein